MHRRLFLFSLLLLATLLASACDKGKPSEHPEELVEAERRAASQPAPPSAIEIGDPLGPIKKRAEAGDLSAMITLGRTYESLGTAAGKAQAREWYEKAAARGDASAAESLANLAAATTRESAYAADASREAMSASTAPSVSIATQPTSRRSSTKPIDLAHLSWQEVLDSLDTTGFVSVSRPDFVPRGTHAKPTFIALATAPDKTITLAGNGPNADDIQAVSVVIRVRNSQDLANNNRIIQAAAICNTVTRQNVTQKELVEWIGKYLQTQIKSEPNFRNGWRVQVSGSAGEGRAEANPNLGQLVLIEMKK